MYSQNVGECFSARYLALYMERVKLLTMIKRLVANSVIHIFVLLKVKILTSAGIATLFNCL